MQTLWQFFDFPLSLVAVSEEPEYDLVREHVYGVDGSKPGTVHLVAGGTQCAGKPTIVVRW